MKKIFSLAIIVLLTVSTGNARARCAGAVTADSCVTFTGAELDMLPFINNGYYASLFYGRGNLRARLIVTRLTTPSFVVPAGFKNLETGAITLLFDYFLNGKEAKGWWLGSGIEYWSNTVKNQSNNTSGSYNNLVFTFGAGCILPVYKCVYINPWGAGHISLSGTKGKDIGGLVYKPSVFMPEISLKIGIVF